MKLCTAIVLAFLNAHGPMSYAGPACIVRGEHDAYRCGAHSCVAYFGPIPR